MLTAIAAFAEAFANPLAPLLVLGFAALASTALTLRLVSAGLGGLLALPHLATASVGESLLVLVGSVAAPLLYAELTLHFVLPALRFARRCVVVSWELMSLMMNFVTRARRHSPALPNRSEEVLPAPPPDDQS